MKPEKTMDDAMTTISETEACERCSDLVAFLYGEATEVEARDFRNHLDACAICRGELSIFGDVRSSIELWRDEALNPTAFPATTVGMHRYAEHTVTTRSAMSAIREFFALSPLWLRGATALASVLFVTLLIVSVLHFFESPQPSVVKQNPVPGVVRPESVLQSTGTQDKAAALRPNEGVPVAAKEGTPRQNKALHTRVVSRSQSNRRTKTPVLTEEERSQLSDLLIAANEDEESVPRLYDLLSESN